MKTFLTSGIWNLNARACRRGSYGKYHNSHSDLLERISCSHSVHIPRERERERERGKIYSRRARESGKSPEMREKCVLRGASFCESL
jgi:hypothetical protein